jgi:oligopeptide/dipeptide ABC transporter ATP-binding protein
MNFELRDAVVCYGYGEHTLTAVDGVDLVVPDGRTFGLVGESGCGKSTIARAIVGLVPFVRGTLLLDGIDYTGHRMRASREFRRRVQMIFQDPYSSLNPRMSVGEMILEALKTKGSRSDRTEALRVLSLVGLSSAAFGRYPHQFSGGQRQRIAIARALAVGPDLIVTDEVTSSLDVSTQAMILTLLRDLQRQLGLSYLFISHDLSTIRAMSDVVSVMYLGRIVETAKTEDLFAAPEHPYTKALLASIPRVGVPRRRAPLSGDLPNPLKPPEGCRFHSRCPIGPLTFKDRTVCIASDPQPRARERRHEAACHFAAVSSALGAHAGGTWRP